VNGIVSGVLLPDGNVDTSRTSELIELSKPLPFTFHRAFDLVDDYEKALEDVISCGAQRVLTSGLANSSSEGIDILKNLNQIAKERIIIMPGGGITQDNITQLTKQTGCKEFHCSAKSKVLNESSENSLVKMNGSVDISEGYRLESNTKTIAQIIQKLNEG
jgi:copper homeostasis protein